MITLTSADLYAWIAAIVWPLSRMLGLIASAPLFGNTSVPLRIKVILGFALTLVVAPAVPVLPGAEPFSWQGLLIIGKEMLIGVGMGFAMRIVFAAVEMAGEVASLTMGFGFATFFDPQTQGRSGAISQLLALLATMTFLAVNAHLVLLEVLVESFYSLPVAGTPFSAGMEYELARWGGELFRAGLQLSLPLVAALLITNVALGILTRAAPQLNIFGIGFPVSLGVGLLVLYLLLPYLAVPYQNLFQRGIEESRSLPRAGAQWVPGQVGPRQLDTK